MYLYNYESNHHFPPPCTGNVIGLNIWSDQYIVEEGLAKSALWSHFTLRVSTVYNVSKYSNKSSFCLLLHSLHLTFSPFVGPSKANFHGQVTLNNSTTVLTLHAVSNQLISKTERQFWGFIQGEMEIESAVCLKTVWTVCFAYGDQNREKLHSFHVEGEWVKRNEL